MSDHDDHDDHDDHNHGHNHDHHEHDVAELQVAVLTISSTRDVENDPAGDAIKTILHEADHSVSVRRVIDDDYDEIQTEVSRMVDRGDVDVTVTTGGTGVTPDDETVEAAEQLFDKTLPGFGELFRHLSYDEIGTRVVGTRATAGIIDGMPVFCLPGSENAARLGTAEILVPEAPHLTGLARRDEA
ncbi:molybdenum cofactor biosynthesis protein [Haloferax mediterranei ATCC 33500]|uniref:Molybdenum cofactor biosynthesis protein n=1 Tax=Haloferax mediterranei (strain ATCC 33500 / DSM 1411 / JCM 8866 / NBRC 14739 / NCIMB 2177 / R-4) TaxID=523841 RepID=I3R7Y4_HALMT|nr:molybdenum cofactor synthesis domain-containing protein [Haloferax mediterranei]AFK20344.1 molybdenum cofactor biosynthesis protein B [Haloferax mediterranei ATCC 33500]AHZ23712.1 molybdenum cofactor biosynthesis protein MoaB [Haloferax mediterranei ATCC 33500]ELZ99200.1 molybdenum cofactor biosynthesis protein B [Haloferax mediterranei ATCC 33500]MDX5986900.1 molybdenum cofactor synthesis domain-containing protein [Haloferax mediterranei ATCC 33500]QCQ76222.1 molybdenum cofactor biosynthes